VPDSQSNSPVYDTGPLAGKPIPGMVQRGNIDVNHRPGITNADGSHSSIYSMTVPIGKDGSPRSWDAKDINGYALVPSIANGKFLTPDGKKPDEKNKAAMEQLEGAATDYYGKTRQHLGVFKSDKDADRYAGQTHAWVNDGSSKALYAPSYDADENGEPKAKTMPNNQQQPTDPYAAIAKPIPQSADPYANMGDTPAAPTPSLGSRMLSGVEDFGKGVAKSYGSAAANIDDLVAKHVPGGQFLTTPLVGGKSSEQARQDLHQQSTPTNTAQKVGNFAGNASQFLIPGGAEEGAVAKGAELAGDAAKFVRPVARIGATALSSGTVNRAQGGGFGAGAAAGGIGAGAGELLNAAAPAVAEKALGIRGKFDRSFNKEPGKAALEETSGLRPETVANSAKQRIGELSKDTENMADQASMRNRTPVRGLLPAPTEDVPLHRAPDIAGTPSRPVVLNQADRPGRLALMPPEHDIPLTEQPFHGHFAPDEGLRDAPINNSRTGSPLVTPEGNPNYGYSDRMPSTEGQWTGGVLRQRNMPEGEASGLGQGQYMGQIPGDRGGVGQVHGVLRQRPSAPIGQAPIPTIEPNTVASLAPARQAVSGAMQGAARQNAEGTYSQLGNMQDFLGRRFSTGEQIPENVTPRELLDLRRGFNEEHGRWNPDAHDTTVATGRQAYGGLTNEFHRVLPEAAENDATVSNLIPVKNRASITALGDNPLAKAAGRVAAHTGAATGGIAGAYEGKREGGIPGAIAGGLAGVVAPEIISSPTGQMAVARMMHSATSLPLVRGAILNAVPGRKNGDQE
jgi:hypothetical protein